MLKIQSVRSLHVHLHQQSSSPFAAILSGAIAQAAGKSVQTFAKGGPIATTPAMGEIWQGQGGRYGGTMPSREGKPGYHLIVAESHGEKLKFGPYDTNVTGAADHYDGQANTKALLAHGKEHAAAAWAADMGIGPHEDFYLPAHAELCQLWINVPHLFAKEGWYWSSTQGSPYHAWAQDFADGYSYFDSKDDEFRAVAVRRLVI
jgi:hypothetical protein